MRGEFNNEPVSTDQEYMASLATVIVDRRESQMGRGEDKGGLGARHTEETPVFAFDNKATKHTSTSNRLHSHPTHTAKFIIGPEEEGDALENNDKNEDEDEIDIGIFTPPPDQTQSTLPIFEVHIVSPLESPISTVPALGTSPRTASALNTNKPSSSQSNSITNSRRRGLAHAQAEAHVRYPGATIFAAPGRAIRVPRVERMRATKLHEGHGIEMPMLPSPGTASDIDGGNVGAGQPTKEEVALAKWRKWVIDQPVATSEPSPLAAKWHPSFSSLQHAQSASPPREGSPTRRTSTETPPSAVPPHQLSATVSSPLSRSSGSGSGSGQGSSSARDDVNAYNTESVRALRDVELAVDESVLARTTDLRQSSRFLSSQPRLSDRENPFVLIAPRLASRRVRPIVLELVQALGHYVDAIWAMQCPKEECPWVMKPEPQASDRTNVPDTPTIAHPLVHDRTWKSHTLSAVHAGKLAGQVPKPDAYQAAFWRAEVEYALHDTNAVVGVMKKQGWGFSRALQAGCYGHVADDNVLVHLPHSVAGGNMARLLNDLEETLWGDAPPRSTDLAYDLPEDFDPYAPPLPGEATGGGGGAGGLVDFLSPSLDAGPSQYTQVAGGSAGGGQGATSPVYFDDVDALDLPPIASHGAVDETEPLETATADQPRSPTSEAPAWNQPFGGGNGSGSMVNGLASVLEGMADADLPPMSRRERRETLEEIGKRRHAEWLARREKQVQTQSTQPTISSPLAQS